MAVILDGYSRKVVGWELGKTLAVRLALAALNKALVERNPGPGLVHHSDRGLQYASSEYVTAAALGIGLPSSGSGELSECNPSVFQTMTNTSDKFSGFLERREENSGHCKCAHRKMSHYRGAVDFVGSKMGPKPTN